MRRLVEDNREGATELGLRVLDLRQVTLAQRKVWSLNLATRDGRLGVRQAYLPHGRSVVILTLAAKQSAIQHHSFDLTQVLEELSLSTPEPSGLIRTRAPPPPNRSPPGAGPGSSAKEVNSRAKPVSPEKAPPAEPSSQPASLPSGAALDQPELETETNP
jgi:hypothetical protein